MEETVTINLDEENYEKAIDFYNVYELETSVVTGDYNKKTFLGDLENRKCRFCGKSKGETTFRRKAHVAPQLIGNRYLLSAFECDTCNKFFGDLYEDSFANFIGAFRPFAFFTPSKNKKYPKHKESVAVGDEEKTRLSIQATGSRHIQLVYEHPFDETIIFDKENKKLTINATRKPYVPLYVYKMLIKMAVALINESEMKSFENTIRLLIDNSQNEKLKGFPLCHVYMHSLYSPPMYPTPILHLYRKKDKTVNCPEKIFVLFSGNHVYQIFLPLNKEDDWLQGKKIKLYPYPLLFDKSMYEKGMTYNSYGILMDSNEKKIAEPQELTFSFQYAQFGDEIE